MKIQGKMSVCKLKKDLQEEQVLTPEPGTSSLRLRHKCLLFKPPAWDPLLWEPSTSLLEWHRETADRGVKGRGLNTCAVSKTLSLLENGFLSFLKEIFIMKVTYTLQKQWKIMELGIQGVSRDSLLPEYNSICFVSTTPHGLWDLSS